MDEKTKSFIKEEVKKADFLYVAEFDGYQMYVRVQEDKPGNKHKEVCYPEFGFCDFTGGKTDWWNISEFRKTMQRCLRQTVKNRENQKTNYTNRSEKVLHNKIMGGLCEIRKSPDLRTSDDKITPSKNADSLLKQAISKEVSNPPMGVARPKRDLTPLCNPNDERGAQSALSTSFALIPVKEGIDEEIGHFLPIKDKKYAYDNLQLVIGFDTEYLVVYDYTDKNNTRHDKTLVLSYQASVHLLDYLITFVFINTNKIDKDPKAEQVKISLDSFLWHILQFLRFKTKKTAKLPPVNQWSDDSKDPNYVEFLPITIISHNGIADIPLLDFHDAVVLEKYKDENGEYNENRKEYKAYLGQVQGGLCTTTGDIHYDSNFTTTYKNNFTYPVKIKIRDTMSQSVGGKSLADIGDSIGYEKIKIDPHWYTKMDEFLATDPVGFFEYAGRDSEICVMYTGIVYGFNKALPLTLMSATTLLAKDNHMGFISQDKYNLDKVKAYLAKQEYKIPVVDDDGNITQHGYNFFLRGIVPIPKGKKKGQRSPSMITQLFDVERYEFASAWVDRVSAIATKTYAGGLNEAYKYGWYEGKHTDIDLEAAYATIMTGLYDVDFTAEPLYASVKKRTYVGMTDEALNDIWGCCKIGILPMDWPIFASISHFKFPDDVYKPCIPIQQDGTLIYPLEASRYITVTGPELFLALQLGASVTIDEIYVCPVCTDENGRPTHHFGNMVLDFLRKRLEAQKKYGKKSMIDLLLKLCCNSLYGKAAQGIKQGTIYDGIVNEAKELGVSPITSPIYASMITSLIRTILVAVINELRKRGYVVYSVTTDGFLTNATLAIIDSLELYGFAERYKELHSYADGRPVMWTEKHTGNYLFQWCTRLNIGFNEDGIHTHNQVFARASYKDTTDYDFTVYTPEEITDLEALNYLKELVKGVVVVKDQRGQTNVRDWQEYNIEPHSFRSDRTLKQHPDFKRRIGDDLKDVWMSFRGIEAPIACFDTLPFANMSEYETYHATIKDRETKVRTVDDLTRLEVARIAKKEDMSIKLRANSVIEKDFVMLVLMGWRTNQITLDAFKDDKRKTGLKPQGFVIDACNEYLKEYNASISVNDYKNAGRRTRYKLISPELYTKLEHTVNALGGGSFNKKMDDYLDVIDVE